MSKFITKSLFVDYCNFPKVAWWRFNDLTKYKKIKKLDNEDLSDQIIELGKTVETLVWDYFEMKYWLRKVDLFPDNPEIISDDNREDDDDTWILDVSFEDKLKRNLKNTKEAILNKEKILFQPWFLVDDCYVRADFMILNNSWNYDLVEVKAKSWVRKKITDDWEEKKIWEIESKFINDVSFQKYIIDQVLVDLWFHELDKIYISHLSSDYIKNGSVDINKLVKIDENVWVITDINILQRWKPTKITRNDWFMTAWIVDEKIKTIKKELLLSEEEFNKIHPFPWNKFLEYFWEDKAFGTVCWIPKLHFSKASIVKDLYNQWKLDLLCLNEEELNLFESSGWSGATRRFLDKYIHCKNNHCVIIEEDIIKEKLNALNFPICFYDYESVSVPIPLLDNTYSYQQVIVQYSLHKLYEDWTIEHFWWILQWEWNFKIYNVSLPDDWQTYSKISNKIIIWTQKEFLNEFLKDIWTDIEKSSFVVWYQWFENSRNKEISEIYPELEKSFLKINEATFDLYEIFSKMHYFDLNFKGSASIKKVLPVLVPNMSYDWLNIWKWDVAMQALKNLISWKIINDNDRIEKIKDLLVYCRQDSLAMLEIYKVLLEI